jgi:3'(2'), 5'-bisphosphate nucleotidase
MDNLKNLVIRAVYQAGNAIMEVYNSNGFNVEFKGEFTVNIALIEEDQPVFGVVYAPVLDKLYYGGNGIGGFLIEKGVEKQLSKKEKSADVVKVVASRSHLNQETQDFIGQFDKVEKVPMGSSLKFIVIAEGNADYYPRYAPTMEWDAAAAQAIVDSIGYKVIEPNIKKPLVYNKENLLNPYLLVK